MDKPTTGVISEPQIDFGKRTDEPAPRANLFGVVWRTLLALIILAGAGYLTYSWISERPEPVKRQARERSFTVAVQEAELGTFQPALSAFGEIVAGRTMEIRAQVSGIALEVSPNLVPGGRVMAGELLMQIDSFDYDGALRQAEADLADARLQLVSARDQLGLNNSNLAAAQQQLDFAQRDLDRAKSLQESGTLTPKAIEDRELLVSQRAQAVAQQKSAVAVQEAAIERQQYAISRAEWSIEQARRAVENTTITAPFDGVIMSTSATEGRLVSNNEALTQLYEIGALEVRFTLSDSEYGQLVADGLAGRKVNITWDVDPRPVTASGEIVRVGAEVDAALGGVTVFARLSGENLANLRPGTFVEVEVEGIAYENAYSVPETAIYGNNTVYIIGPENRMQPVRVEIETRDGPNVIVTGDIPPKSRLITTHLAQAGQGVLIQVEGEEAAEPRFGGTPGQNGPGASNREGADSGGQGRPEGAEGRGPGGAGQRGGGQRPAAGGNG